MRIVLAMTYYRPYVSGPIVYADNLAAELVRRGHEVTILTSRYEPGLARDEEVDGVRIVRIPVLARISKGVLMPTYLGVARSILRASDAVVIQVPQFEAPILAALARLMQVPAVLTYHCDVRLPGGWFNRVADRVILVGNQLATLLARRVVAYTADYAEHSPVMRRRLGRVTIIPPPVDLAPPAPADVARFREAHGLGRATIGIAARFATEKGFEHLLDAVPRLLEEFPDLRVLHAGEFEHVIGEEGYRERLRPLLTRAGDHWVPLGVVSGAELAVFYAACDVTVLPSLNRTESFGFVQIESMLCGTPVVASALPGVRVPIATTGMGLVVPPGDAPALAAAIGNVLRAPNDFRARRREVTASYSPARTADGYEQLLEELVHVDQARAEARELLWPHLRDLPGFRAMIRAMEARLVGRRAPLPAPVLDLGTGDGHFATAVLGRVDVGVDRSAEALYEARRRDVYQAVARTDATALPFADGSFASVFSNCVIEHIADLAAVLTEVHRVMRPGGELVLTVPTPRLNDELAGNRLLLAVGAPRTAARYRRGFAKMQRHEHMYTPEEWARRVVDAGFDVVEQRGYMSARAARIFDVGHVTGLPTVVTRRLTGRWVMVPRRWWLAPKERLLVPLVAEHDPPDATGCFIVARKRASAAEE